MRTFALPMIAIVLLASAAYAQQGNSLSVVLNIDSDGSALAVERFERASPLHEPIHWRISTASTTPLGVRRLLFIDVLEVTDARDNKLTIVKREFGDKLEIIVPVQSLAGNAIRITYEVRNAVRFREANDELFWPIGQGWSEPFRQATIDVSVPDHAAGQFTGQLLRGGARSLAPQAMVVRGVKASLEIDQPSRPNGMAIDLVFAPGVLQQPSFVLRAAWFLKANPIILLPGVLLLAMVGLRKYSSRGEGPQMLIMPRYETPEVLPPAEAGYLIDGSLEPRDLAAMLLDLARRGFIRIEAGSPDEEVPYPAPDFILRLLKPMDDWKGAYPYEHTMLFHTFYGGQWTKLSSLSLRFYAIVPVIENMIQDALQNKQLYVSPRRIVVQRLSAVIVLAAVLAGAQAAGWFAVAQSWLLGAVVVVSFTLVALLFARGIHRRTAKGERVYTDLRGFQVFLDSVEADRMERVTPDLFERYLPYAVALGVEHRWGAAFSTISTGPPLWWDAAKSGGIPDFVHLVNSSAHLLRRGPATTADSPKQRSAVV